MTFFNKFFFYFTMREIFREKKNKKQVLDFNWIHLNIFMTLAVLHGTLFPQCYLLCPWQELLRQPKLNGPSQMGNLYFSFELYY